MSLFPIAWAFVCFMKFAENGSEKLLISALMATTISIICIACEALTFLPRFLEEYSYSKARRQR